MAHKLPNEEPAVPVQSTSTAAVQDGSVEAAMAGLIGALVRKDIPAFLQFFSRSRSFRFVGTIQPRRPSDLVKYDDFARELLARDTSRGWYSIIFDGGPDDSLALMVDGSSTRAWKRVTAQKFVPPDDDEDSTLFVTWRKEGGRWVVESIGYPGA